MKNLTKHFILCLSMACLSTAYGAAKGTNSGGGGDASEERVNEIRSDILKWIKNGGAKELDLTNSVSYGEYVSNMTEILQPKKVVIGFVEKDSDTNEELQVSVNGVPKTCRGFYSKVDSKPHILCSIPRFKATSESAQYKLIHHEYAGLVNVETNEEAASDYEISSQITDFLEIQKVLKLAVKKAAIVKSVYMEESNFEFKSEEFAKIAGEKTCEKISSNFKNPREAKNLKKKINYLDGSLTCHVRVDNKKGIFKKSYKFYVTLSYVEAPIINTNNIPFCKDSDLSSVEVGFKCLTSKNGIYERVVYKNFGEAWKGLDGQIWSAKVGSGRSGQSYDVCNKLDGRVPADSDFDSGEEDGFREVLPDMHENDYWTSTSYPEFLTYEAFIPKQPQYFKGDSGFYTVGGEQINSIRCIALTEKPLYRK